MLRKKFEKMAADTFLNYFSFQFLITCVIIGYIIQGVALKLCYDAFVRRKGKLNKMS